MGLAAWMTDGTQIGIDSRWATVDGARMHYLKAGNGPPLVLIHGLIGSAFSWRGNMQGLAENWTVYAVDLLGLGESERVPGLNASMSATADRMVKFLDAVQIVRADVVGTSHGGAIAMLLAANYPERVGKLVLVAPANPYSDQSDAIIRFYRTSLGKWFAPHVANLPAPLQEIALGRMYGDPNRVLPGTLGNYMSSLRVEGTATHVMNILESWFADMKDVEASLDKLANKPMLLLWGDKDRAVSMESAYNLKKRLRKAELVIMHGAGHLPYEELPSEFNRDLAAWLQRPDADGRVRKSLRRMHLVRSTSLSRT